MKPHRNGLINLFNKKENEERAQVEAELELVHSKLSQSESISEDNKQQEDEDVERSEQDEAGISQENIQNKSNLNNSRKSC